MNIMETVIVIVWIVYVWWRGVWIRKMVTYKNCEFVSGWLVFDDTNLNQLIPELA